MPTLTPDQLGLYQVGTLDSGIPGWMGGGSIQFADPLTGNTTGYTGNIPLYGPLPAGVLEYSLPDYMKQARALADAPAMNVNQFMNSPQTAPTSSGFVQQPAPAPAPQTGNIGGLNQGFPNFSPASLFNLLLASRPPRPAPPGPNIFNPSTFMAPLSTGGSSGFQLPQINTQSHTDIANAFQPYQQNAVDIVRFGAPPRPQATASVGPGVFPFTSIYSGPAVGRTGK